MIVFDLRCANDHVFEAWFASSGDYAGQRERGLLHCPLCGDGAIDKAVMAPAVATKGNRAVGDTKAALRALATAQAKLLEGSQWVGGTFATRARAMHAGDEPTATIHGRATLEDAKALVSEGVPIAPLPLPVIEPSARN